MLFRLVRPVRRSGSENFHFVQRIPSDLIGRTGGLKLSIPLGDGTHHDLTLSAKAKDVRFSLKTREPSLVRSRQASAAGYLTEVWAALRADAPVPLSHRQATALAGELYRGWAGGADSERSTSVILGEGDLIAEEDAVALEEERTAFRAQAEHFRALISSETAQPLETALGPLVDRLLMRRGIVKADPKSRRLLLIEFARALADAFDARGRNADGDYTPDPKSQRFPVWEQAKDTTSATARSDTNAHSLKGMLEAWWCEAKAAGRKPSTYESYRNSMAAFVAFLRHEDAGRVTPEDVVRFKDHRLSSTNKRTGKTISPKTVKDSDLAGLKTIFGWALANRKLTSNPAAGITIKLGKTRKLRSKGFTDTEAHSILAAALSYVAKGSEAPRTVAAKRWVPWLCAYTGARVGELAQLRKQDLRQEGGLWVVRITPEAGTVKTDEARDVVLHEHLVEQGFPQFVAAAPPGHLFLRPGEGGDVRGPLRGLKNRLAEFARAIVPDPNVAPNHAWRHRFKTIGIEAGISHRVLDAIQGQAARTVAETYGEVTIRTMASELRKIPKIVADYSVELSRPGP